MPAKEIKELRRAGKLEEALAVAKSELQAEPNNIWAKRNLSWVYYDVLKQSAGEAQFASFIAALEEIKQLQLPTDEVMLFEQLSWPIGMMNFALVHAEPGHTQKPLLLFESIHDIPFQKPSEGYSFLFKALHKALKESDRYLEFADWWGFEHFRDEDLQKDKLPNGKEVMAIAEQAYIAYAKHLLPKKGDFGEPNFDREKATQFIPKLEAIVEAQPAFQYPAYFLAKLLLALGDKDNMLVALLPFAKKKRNDFWVWEILAEAFAEDPEKVFACYCRALLCTAPEEMLINLRQKMAALLIFRKQYREARTELDLLISTRSAHSYRIPAEVAQWQAQEWYSASTPQKSNYGLYKNFGAKADALLFSDVAEESVIVEFVNTEKKIVSFIASESKVGFFKYDRFLQHVTIGDVLHVRFNGDGSNGYYKVLTLEKSNDDSISCEFLNKVEGVVRINDGKAFGFLENAFVPPALIKKYRLENGQAVKGRIIKTLNTEKRVWGWKVFEMELM